MLAKIYNGLSLKYSNIKITRFAKSKDSLKMTNIAKKNKEKITTQDTKVNNSTNATLTAN